ncbi:MAG TPA: YicC/YloC family endoribonuclease [Myxococcota bacterium]|nr:YicC/YloC family endoribonuclease [Myxococcota bacterium]
MIHSMTGFGSARFRVGEWTFELEIRSVNHRHFDARIRLPRLLTNLEPDVRARLQARLARGKVDLTVTAPEGGAPAPRLEVDLAAAREYLAAGRALAASDGVRGELDAASLLALPGVSRFVEPELADGLLRERTLAAVDEGLAALFAMRASEGAALARDLRARLDRVLELAGALEQRSGLVQESVRERLRKRARQLEAETGLLDEARLHMEIAIAAERMDVTEEIVRLRSHVDQFRALLDAAAPGRPVGRQLEFLLQELAREANTVGSKGSDAPIAHWVVELKTEVERLREQVQNVE